MKNTIPLTARPIGQAEAKVKSNKSGTDTLEKRRIRKPDCITTEQGTMLRGRGAQPVSVYKCGPVE
ncbi:MAG: hypothetical protein WBA74_06205, partial [Cyclobacteriaceae bacterium]